MTLAFKFQTEFLSKWFVVMPEIVYQNINMAYIYNCNSWVREYSKYHDKLLSQIRVSTCVPPSACALAFFVKYAQFVILCNITRLATCLSFQRKQQYCTADATCVTTWRLYMYMYVLIQNNRRLTFLDCPAKLNEYIDADQQKLPGATVNLEEDLKVFNSALRLSHKDTKVVIKVRARVKQCCRNNTAYTTYNLYLNNVYMIVVIALTTCD